MIDEGNVAVFGRDCFRAMMAKISDVSKPEDLEEYCRWSWLGTQKDRDDIEGRKQIVNDLALAAEKASKELKAQEKADQLAKKNADQQAKKLAEQEAKKLAASAKAAAKKDAKSSSSKAGGVGGVAPVA